MHTMMGMPASDSSSDTTASAGAARGGGGNVAEDTAQAHARVVEAEALLETWMLLEYCDQGNLENASRDGRFTGDFVRLPPLIL